MSINTSLFVHICQERLNDIIFQSLKVNEEKGKDRHWKDHLITSVLDEKFNCVHSFA
jgi:hypothetical protein